MGSLIFQLFSAKEMKTLNRLPNIAIAQAPCHPKLDSVSQNHSPKSGTTLSHLKSLKLVRLFFVATQAIFGRKITMFATQIEPLTLLPTVATIK